ncbi:hypothetical protein PFISCL1PPCAC_5649, partial [Pristionchus fissidentatus]
FFIQITSSHSLRPAALSHSIVPAIPHFVCRMFLLLFPSLLLSIVSIESAVITGETGSRRTELVEKVEENAKGFEKELEKLLETSGDLSLIEIREKVDNLVGGMDEETRKRHESWKIAQHTRDNERRERLKDAIMKLSKPAQAKLIRIIFVQEDEELTQNEKRARLNAINKSLPFDIRQELVTKLKDTDVLSGFGLY